MYFEVLGAITRPETIASGRDSRDRERKRKGFATVRLLDGTITRAEVHWYEAYGIGRKEIKLKQLLGEE